MLGNCMLKHCLPLKTLIPNFVHILLLGIAFSCIWMISSTVITTKREFTPVSVSFSPPPGRWTSCITKDMKTTRFLDIAKSALKFVYANEKYYVVIQLPSVCYYSNKSNYC